MSSAVKNAVIVSTARAILPNTSRGDPVSDLVNALLPFFSIGFSCFGLGYIIGYVRGRD